MPPLGDRRTYLPRVAAPRWVVFADFDETYLAHDGSPERRRDRRSLEQLLLEEATALGLVFGWVADGPIDVVAATVGTHGLRVVPHFIASSWGAELDFFSREEGRRPVAEWDARVAQSGFSRARVASALDDLLRRGIPLVRREQAGRRIDSYTFQPSGRGRSPEITSILHKVAERHGIGVHVYPCHPALGEPEGTYDVDFVPRGVGKRQVVDFVLDRLGIPRARAFSFGDDVGDVDMLSAVEHGYLVDNATDDARRRFSRTAGASYARGILDVIERRIERARL
ncbi:HAD hydrolase family protein [Polyangium mundeleinium]|uniref:HAD hydrolase family protein n=1 Tax=Polyangium mundeleinium TaxID=2995306 RepID=A0ABT5ESX9_9BACT|nr:HAD hydrolase family protein [Polyangium mundeleinium]MDC0744027.1 HAD hydrolase family protein [Polyangium mundeleinium]